MPAAIVPLSEVPRARLEEYLQASTRYFRDRGPAAVGWKYYDEAFNRGRLRGLAWLRDGRVHGFIGVVPAQLVRRGEVVPLAWTCDWGLADPKAAPGMGILLLRKAIATAAKAATIGGNATTRTLVPRLAARTFADAGGYYWRPLRADALLHLASARAPALRRLIGSPLGALPLPWRLGARQARVVDGVAPQLDRLFDALAQEQWTVRYDVAHLQWALERCPGIVSGSCFVDGDRGPAAGAVFWYDDARAVRHVRFVMWSQPDAGDAAAAVVVQVVRSARQRGGALISTVAGRWDDDVVRVLLRMGFFARQSASLPLYVFSPDVDSLRGVNYLATDLAQRFSAEGPREAAA